MTNHTLPSKVDLSRVILWQYNEAERLQAIIKALEESAEMCSADIWKNLPILFNISNEITADDDLRLKEIGMTMISNLFGIKLPTIDVSLGEVERLEIIRRYIIGKIYLMDSDGSCRDINEFLRMTMPEITAYVYEVDSFWNESYHPTINYVIPTDLEETHPLLFQLIQVEDFLPRPAGVKIGEFTHPEDLELGMQQYTSDDETEETKIEPSAIREQGLDTFNHSNFKRD